jgi:hypothetical protein
MSIEEFFTKTDNIPSIVGIQRAALFHREDYDRFSNLMKRMRLYNWYHDYDSSFNLSLMINEHIKKRFDDHHPTMIYDTKIEAQSASIGHNKIPSSGVVGILLILANQSNRFFNYASLGRSNIPETIGQQRLIDEEVRISMVQDGNIVAKGNIMNHFAQFGYGVRTGKYVEFGIHDGPIEPSLMFSRSVLPNAMDHIQGDGFMSGSHTTVLVPE